MLDIYQLVNNISLFFKVKIIVFNENKILLKSNSHFSNVNFYSPRKEKRTKLFNHYHPIIKVNNDNSYIYVPVYMDNQKKYGIIWNYQNSNNFFININDEKLNLIVSVSEIICNSMKYGEISNINKVYSGILDCLQENLNINLNIYMNRSKCYSVSENENNDNFTNYLSRDFYSNGNFIGGFKVKYSNNHISKNEIVNKNAFIQSKKYNRIIGKSPQLNSVLNIINQVAKTNSTVLLRGESGTGKERFARLIHKESQRHNHPFVAINCAAIPENLLESELFGYEKGAFTGANNLGKIGKIESANKGTLFLDEIGDMPLSIQVKLLRVIQERYIERIGGNQLIPIDIRIICATNKNLEDMIAIGEFREDLFYRINVIPIVLPSLTNKHNDIELLLNYYLKKYCILQKKHFMSFSYDALEYLKNYNWPGNIRELINTIEYCVTMSSSEIINIENLPEQIKGVKRKNNKSEVKNKKISKKDFLQLLENYGDSTEEKKKLAQHLNISLATLYRWIEKYSRR